MEGRLMDADAEIRAYLAKGVDLREAVAEGQVATIRAMADRLVACLISGGKVLLCGNGGSAADAQHIAAEFINKFYREGKALPALALTTDTAVLTSIANDTSFEQVFARQVEAHGREGDCLIAISTSGSSPNVLRAAEAARRAGMTVIGFTGATGVDLASRSDLVLRVPSSDTPQIQEIHIAVGHILSKIVEEIARA